jgi:hypothetical protein
VSNRDVQKPLKDPILSHPTIDSYGRVIITYIGGSMHAESWVEKNQYRYDPYGRKLELFKCPKREGYMVGYRVNK